MTDLAADRPATAAATRPRGRTLKFVPINAGQMILWFVFVVALLVSPLIFKSSLSLTILSQIGTIIIVCLSYNMLLGQAGMLSFGHAVYVGLGAFISIHAMNAIAADRFHLPVSLIPL